MVNEFGRVTNLQPARPATKAERESLAASRALPEAVPHLRPDTVTVVTTHERIERLRETRISNIDARLSEMRGQFVNDRNASVHQGRARGAFQAKAASRELSR